MDNKTNINCSMMVASVCDVLIVLHVLCQLIMDSTTIYILDINECATNGGLGPCAQICTNTPGSFSCSCKAGYILSVRVLYLAQSVTDKLMCICHRMALFTSKIT